jgi:hypothetical protein
MFCLKYSRAALAAGVIVGLAMGMASFQLELMGVSAEGVSAGALDEGVIPRGGNPPSGR